MELIFNANNFLHFSTSLILTIFIASVMIHLTDYIYRIHVYLTASMWITLLIGIFKEIYDYIVKTPNILDTSTDLLSNAFGIFVAILFILTFTKETDRQ